MRRKRERDGDWIAAETTKKGNSALSREAGDELRSSRYPGIEEWRIHFFANKFAYVKKKQYLCSGFYVNK